MTSVVSSWFGFTPPVYSVVDVLSAGNVEPRSS